MADRILLGIDLGTTALKVGAFDAEGGALRAVGERRLRVRVLPGGGMEQDLGLLARALGSVLGELREALGADWRSICGLGVAAQGGSSIIVDRETGRPRTPMILWNDGRGHRHSAHLAETQPPGRWRAHALNEVPPHGLGRLAWLKETRPELFTEEHLHVGAGEHLFFRLTGTWRQDPGNAIQVGSYHAVRKVLDGGLLALVNVPLSFVAPLREGHETAPLSARGARSIGVPEGTPVAGPYIDQEAGYLASVGISERPLQCSLGTAWVGNFVLPHGTTGSSPSQLALPSPLGEGRLVVQPLLAGNVAWDWGLERLLGPPRSRALARAAEIFAESLLPAWGLHALPWLAQPNPLEPGAPGGGAFLGLSPRTDRSDLIRALAAGLAFELARVLGSVVRSGIVDGVVLTGGASRGAHFRALLAALLAPLPVHYPDEEVSAPARGSVFAHGGPAALLRARRAPPPPEALALEIRNRYDSYLALFERLCGSVRGGASFRLGGEGS